MQRSGFGVVIAFVVASAGGARAAPPPPTADEVLARVRAYYATAKELHAKFRQTVTNTTFGTTLVSDGELWLAKPALLRADYVVSRGGAAVPTRSFVFDGTTTWYIDHTNHAIVQAAAKSVVLPVAVSFLLGGSTATHATFDTSGRHVADGDAAIALTPQLVFVVAPDGHVRESIVTEANGDSDDFRFFEPDSATRIPAATFQVAPARLPNYKLTIQP